MVHMHMRRGCSMIHMHMHMHMHMQHATCNMQHAHDEGVQHGPHAHAKEGAAWSGLQQLGEERLVGDGHLRRGKARHERALLRLHGGQGLLQLEGVEGLGDEELDVGRLDAHAVEQHVVREVELARE